MRSFVVLVTLFLFCTVLNAFPTTYLRPFPDPMDPRFRSQEPEPINDVSARPTGLGIPCYGARCSGHNIKCCRVETPTGTKGRCINPQFEKC